MTEASATTVASDFIDAPQPAWTSRTGSLCQQYSKNVCLPMSTSNRSGSGCVEMRQRMASLRTLSSCGDSKARRSCGGTFELLTLDVSHIPDWRSCAQTEHIPL